MIDLKITPAQNNWIEVTWTLVEPRPDVVMPATPALYDADGVEVRPAKPEVITPQPDKRTELKHTSYHPTQLSLLQADAAQMGTPLDDHMAMLQAWVDSYVPPPPEPPKVPDSVTMRQARLALLGAGKLAAVDAAIDAMPEPQKSAARIEWDYSNELQRTNPLVLALGPALNLTAAEIDALFIAAAAL